MTNKLDLKTIRACLLDLDGTLYLGPKLFPFTLDFLECLKQHTIKRLFLTNNSFQSTQQYLEKLNRLGFNATEEEILTSGWATIHYLRTETSHRKIYLMGSEGLIREFSDAGFQVVNAESPHIDSTEKPEALVLGFDRAFDYAKLKTASWMLLEGIPYYATHPDKVCPTDGHSIPDAGATIDFLKACTGREPQVIGKPNATMTQAALARTQTLPPETAMIGDRLYTDMRMAVEGGLKAFLVLSGEATLEDLTHSSIQPDLVLRDVGELAERLNKIYYE